MCIIYVPHVVTDGFTLRDTDEERFYLAAKKKLSYNIDFDEVFLGKIDF